MMAKSDDAKVGDTVVVHGTEYEKGSDGWLHSTQPDKDGEYVMTPDNGRYSSVSSHNDRSSNRNRED